MCRGGSVDGWYLGSDEVDGESGLVGVGVDVGGVKRKDVERCEKVGCLCGELCGCVGESVGV